MSIIIQQAEVFSDIDADHAVATIKRMGGGLYRFFAIDGTEPEDEYEGEVPDSPDLRGFSSWTVATNHAGKFVTAIEGDPAVTMDRLALRKAELQIGELTTSIAQLQTAKEQEAIEAERQRQALLRRVDSLERQLDEATKPVTETPSDPAVR